MKNSEKIILKMKENNGVITYNDIKNFTYYELKGD